MGLVIDPLTATIGAEIGGVDLSEDLAEDVVADIRDALLDWKVIFFRDQHLDRDGHVAFGRRFGDLEVHPLTPQGQDHPEVFVLPSEGTFRAPDVWHSDVTWRPEPSMGSILRIVEMPPLGGDTLWADMGLAYDLLPEDMRQEIDDLVGLHDYLRAFGRLARNEEARARMRDEHPIVEHPVVRTHPETKRKTLYVNGAFTCGIKGMPEGRAAKLLDRLERQATVPDVQCRFRWRPGSVAFWDNRATQHCVSNDFLPARRVMERVTVVGDRPY